MSCESHIQTIQLGIPCFSLLSRNHKFIL